MTINNTNYEIVGKYYVQVQSANEFTDEETGVSGINKSSLINSNYCEIAEPATVVLQGPSLPDCVFIEDTKSLKITANANDATYKWYKTTTKPTLTEENPIINDNAPTTAQEITNLTPGWYQGQAIVSKNRFNKEAHTEACKVVNNPVAPEITDIVRITLGDDGEVETSMYEKIGNDFVLDDDGEKNLQGLNLKPGDKATIRIKVKPYENGELDSEGLTYHWYKAINYGTPQLLSDFKTDTIEVDGVDNTTHSYYCIVINHLSSKTAESSTNTSEYTIHIY